MQTNERVRPLLSICIPTYNRRRYLEELLPEAIRQIVDLSQGTVEVLVSDNCSTDGTADYLRATDSTFLTWWTNKSNIGGDRNFLKCIQEARGEYVWLVGDDDLLAEQAVRRVCEVIHHDAPGLIIDGPVHGGDSECYADYRNFLLATCRENQSAAMAHTLISANVFRKSAFVLPFAEEKLYTQYAHMFGLMKGLSGSVRVMPRLISVRPVRAPFAEFPVCLCVKQAFYLWYLASRFNIPRFKWYAIKNVGNLPLEYLSRLKNYFRGKSNAV